jgi:hypothetical protein
VRTLLFALLIAGIGVLLFRKERVTSTVSFGSQDVSRRDPNSQVGQRMDEAIDALDGSFWAAVNSGRTLECGISPSNCLIRSQEVTQ